MCDFLLKSHCFGQLVSHILTLVMSLILVFTIYMILYAITLCFIMFICPFVGPLIWTNKILSYLTYLLTSGNCQGGDLPPTNSSKGRFCASPLNAQNCTMQLHTCDRVAMLQLEICKFLAGDLVSITGHFLSTYLVHVFIVN